MAALLQLNGGVTMAFMIIMGSILVNSLIEGAVEIYQTRKK